MERASICKFRRPRSWRLGAFTSRGKASSKLSTGSWRGQVELHCFGGFVVAEHYGLIRATADVDVLESMGTDLAAIARLAGKGSRLHAQHKVYVDVVTVADVPDDYDARLIDMDVEWADTPSAQSL